MARWVPFVGLTAVVLTLLLGLARLSQGLVRDGPPQLPPGSDGVADDDTDASDPRADRHREATHGDSVPADSSGGESSLAGSSDTACRDRARRAGSRHGDGAGLTAGALLANVALTQGLFGGILLAGALFYEIPGDALGVTASPWSTGLPAVALGAGFGLALWLGNEASAAVADAVGATYDEKLRSMLAPDSRSGWVVLLGLVLPVIALVEEFIFRAAVVGVPAAGFGVSPWALAVVSSAAFALGHGAQGRVGVAVTGGLGFVLAAGFVLSGSLLVVVVAHYLVNALEFLVHEWLGADRLAL